MTQTVDTSKNILFIHPRKGLYRVTRCNDCGSVFECERCDANLITYRSSLAQLKMVCHQCQSHYSYPVQCKKCNSTNINSIVGGADELCEQLTSLFGFPPIRYDIPSIQNKPLIQGTSNHNVATTNPLPSWHSAITTRIYDPSIPYSLYSTIVFVHAENIFSSPDYQIQEESMRQIAQVFDSLSAHSTVFFDSSLTNNPIFEDLKHQYSNKVARSTSWYGDFLVNEAQSRQKFEFPPFCNLLLFTSHNKSKTLSHSLIHNVYKELEHITQDLPSLTLTPPYEAKFLKRRDMYSYHTLMRYPKQYQQFTSLRKRVEELGDRFFVQIRLNPRHLF